MNRIVFVAIVAAVLSLVAAATAGDCHHFFAQPVVVKQVVQHHAQAVIAYPQVAYYAGRDVEADALAEKVARLVTLRLTAATNLTARAAQQAPELPPRESVNIVMEKCGKCHSGAAPKGGLTLDGATGLPCDAITASLRAIKDDRMPKGAPLSPEEKGLLMEALLALESK